MNGEFELFSDGSFHFGRAPSFGWLAVAAGRVIGQGAGYCSNDGTNNVAAEIRGGLEALKFAFGAGCRQVRLHSDLATLGLHFRARFPRPGSQAEAATRWLLEHPEMTVDFVFRRDSDRLVRRAHNLCRQPMAA